MGTSEFRFRATRRLHFRMPYLNIDATATDCELQGGSLKQRQRRLSAAEEDCGTG